MRFSLCAGRNPGTHAVPSRSGKRRDSPAARPEDHDPGTNREAPTAPAGETDAETNSTPRKNRARKPPKLNGRTRHATLGPSTPSFV
jgi:hypothetical protein